MNKHTAFARISLLFASILGSINIASGDWFITDGEIDNASASVSIPANSSQSGKAVCYIKETGIYYTSLDKALDVAEGNSIADTICVIPNLGFDVTISESHGIESVDSLVLPYLYNGLFVAGGKNIETGKKVLVNDATYGDGTVTFADQDDNAISKYRQTRVMLSNDTTTNWVTLTVSGTLLIGGKFGRPTQGVSGSTSGSYCEMVLSAYSKIVCANGGQIECDGYIKRSNAKDNYSKLEVQSGGKLTTPFVIYDYKGGNKSKAATEKGVSPFYVFDFPNVQTEVRINNGAYWTGTACLYALGAFVTQDLCFIAPSNDSNYTPVLIQKSGTIVVSYVPANNGYTTDKVDGTKTQITIDNNGEVDLGSIYFSYGEELSIDSKNFFFPISYRLGLAIKTGSTFNASKKMKLLPGSSLAIEEKALLNVSAPIAIYSNDFDNNIGDYRYPSTKSDGSSKLESATLTNNGTINVIQGTDTDGAIGGSIASSTKAAKLNYSTKVYAVSSPEVSSFVTQVTDSGTTVTIANATNYSCIAVGMLPNDSGSFTSGYIEYGNYKSISLNGAYGWHYVKTIELKTTENKQDGSCGWAIVQADTTSKNLSWYFVDSTDTDEEIDLSGSGISKTEDESDPSKLEIKKTSINEQQITIKVVDNDLGDEGTIVVKLQGRAWKITTMEFKVAENPKTPDDDKDYTSCPLSVKVTKEFLSATDYKTSTKYVAKTNVNSPSNFDTEKTLYYWYMTIGTGLKGNNSSTNEKIVNATLNGTPIQDSTKITTEKPTKDLKLEIIIDGYVSGQKENTAYVQIEFMAVTTIDSNNTQTWPSGAELSKADKVTKGITLKFYASTAKNASKM